MIICFLFQTWTQNLWNGIQYRLPWWIPEATFFAVTLNRSHCITALRQYFRIQIFSRFWTKCGNSRISDVFITIHINRHILVLKWKFSRGVTHENYHVGPEQLSIWCNISCIRPVFGTSFVCTYLNFSLKGIVQKWYRIWDHLLTSG